MPVQSLQQVVPVAVATVKVSQRFTVVAQSDAASRTEDLIEALQCHTPANFLRRHHGYYGMTRLEAEQYIWQHQVP